MRCNQQPLGLEPIHGKQSHRSILVLLAIGRGYEILYRLTFLYHIVCTSGQITRVLLTAAGKIELMISEFLLNPIPSVGL